MLTTFLRVVGVAINEIGNIKGISGLGFSDYSGGAYFQDRVDLVASSWENPHRNYIWSISSKSLLKQYKTERNGGVNVEAFTYQDSGYQIEAVKIIGKTLYEI